MISVLVPAYNCARWIEDALRSMAGQSLRPAEILVADDASVDGTADLVESLGIDGVRVLRSDGNHGISWQLNRLVEESKGRYLARMDGDDIALPERLEIQLEAMRKRSLAICGSWTRRFGAADTLHKYSVDDAHLKAGILFSVPFCHPTVVIDRERLASPPSYDQAFNLAEDYHLWVRIRNSATFGNVPKVLLNWRMHSENAGTNSRTAPLQRQTLSKVRGLILAEYGVSLDPAELKALEDRGLSRTLGLEESEAYLRALAKIATVPEELLGTSRSILRESLSEHWNLSCLFSAWSTTSILPLWWRGHRTLGRIPTPSVGAKIVLKRALRRTRS